ncbi:MAG: hypothetical protein KIT16_04755 [Rhodospirillaceae bacterium]|nr:hypothetical protein [Rhodospirillaceae bacterium]
MFKTAAALAAALALGACSYNAESSFLGYHSSISYSTPGAAPPPSPPPAGYYDGPQAYSPPAGCYMPGHYNRRGFWVPGRYRAC